MFGTSSGISPVNENGATGCLTASFNVSGAIADHLALQEIDLVGPDHAHEREAAAFSVFDSIDGDSVPGDYGGAMPGVVRLRLQWQTSLREEPALQAEPPRGSRHERTQETQA